MYICFNLASILSFCFWRSFKNGKVFIHIFRYLVERFLFYNFIFKPEDRLSFIKSSEIENFPARRGGEVGRSSGTTWHKYVWRRGMEEEGARGSSGSKLGLEPSGNVTTYLSSVFRSRDTSNPYLRLRIRLRILLFSSVTLKKPTKNNFFL